MKPQRRQPFNRLLCLGFVFLPLANVARWVLERHSSMPEGPRDAIFGLLFGIGMGCMLLGIRRLRRPGGSSDTRSCAP